MIPDPALSHQKDEIEKERDLPLKTFSKDSLSKPAIVISQIIRVFRFLFYSLQNLNKIPPPKNANLIFETN